MRRRGLRWGSGPLLILVILLALPLVVKWQAEKQLRHHFADQAEITDVDINIFTGRVAVTGLSSSYIDQALAESGDLVIELSLPSLWNDEIRARSFTLRHARLSLVYHDDGRWQLGRRIFTPGEEPGDEPSGSPWFFSVDQASFEDVTILFSGPGWDDTIVVSEATVSGLSSRTPDSEVRLQARATVDGAGFEFDLTGTPLAERPRLSGSVGIDGVQVADLDLSARLMPLGDRRSQGVLRGRLELDVQAGDPMQVGLEGELTVDGLLAAKGGNVVQLQDAAWNGRVDLIVDEATLEVDQHGEVRLEGLRIDGDQYSLSNGSFLWKGDAKFTTEAGGSYRGEAKGEARLDGLDFSDKAQNTVGAEALGWSGDYRFSGMGESLRLDGEARVTGQSVQASGDSWEAKISSINWTSQPLVMTRDGKAFTNEVDGMLELGDVLVTLPSLQVEQQAGLSWRGHLTLESDGQGVPTSQGNGHLELPGSRIHLTERAEVLAIASATWEGDWDRHVQGETGAVTRVSGAFSAESMNVTGAGDRQLMAAERIAVAGIEATLPGDGVRFSGLEGRGLRALSVLEDGKPSSPVLELDQLTLGASQISLEGGGDLGALNLDGLRLQLVRGPDGSFVMSQDEDQKKPETAVEVSTTDGPQDDGERRADQATPAWSLASLEVSGNSRIRFEDRSIDPTYLLDVALAKLSATALNTAPESEPGTIALQLKADEYTSLKLDGTLRPDPEAPVVALTGRLDHVDMTRLNGYLVKSLGHRATSGQLDAGLAFTLDGGVIGGAQELRIERFELEPVASQARDELEAAIGMPLSGALTMLRDRKDNIVLSLPVSGSLDDPKFDLSDAISTAVAKATKTAMLGVLTFALQPYGAIILAADMAMGMNVTVQLDPLPFQPGSEAEGTKTGEYVERLTTLLGERPGVRLNACGKAVEADRRALQKAALAAAGGKPAASAVEASSSKDDKGSGQDGVAGDAKPPAADKAVAPLPEIADDRLLELAGARAAMLKRALVDKGIEPGRVFVCDPVLEAEEGAQPRVDLFL